MLSYIDGLSAQWRCADCNAEYSPDYIYGLDMGMKAMSDQAKHATTPLTVEIERLKRKLEISMKRTIELQNKATSFPQAQSISGEEARRILIEDEKRHGGHPKYAIKPAEIDDEHLLWTGAKIKKRSHPKTGQPRYYIRGYAARGQDVEKVIIWLHKFNPDNYE